MSVEKPSSSGSLNPERASVREFTGGRLAIDLNSLNQSFFEKMSEGGKRIAKQIYEGMYNTPGAKRIIGKLEIAYNQFWLDRHEKKAAGKKGKIDGLDIQFEALEKSKEEIKSVIEDLKKENIPGVESLQLKLKDIDRQKMELLNKKDKAQSKFESKDNKMKNYANRRDLIADKLIGRYDEKLKPLEKELDRLQEYRDEADLIVAVTEAKHQNELAKLENIEAKKTKIEDALRMTGMSERAIRKSGAVKVIDDILAQGRNKIRKEKEGLEHRKAEINRKIAKVDKKANPYRDKKNEFLRVKQGRPLKMEVETRKEEYDYNETEETRAHKRAETSKPETAEEKETPAAPEAEEKKEKQWTIEQYIAGYNRFLKETYGEANVADKVIDEKEFFKRKLLGKKFKLDPAYFKNILMAYCKLKKMPMDNLDKNIENFLDELKK